MSEYDDPTTSYGEIAEEWLDYFRNVVFGWKFWMAFLILQTYLVILTYTSPAYEPVPVWQDVVFYVVLSYLFIRGWRNR